jgi:hypothetical protein
MAINRTDFSSTSAQPQRDERQLVSEAELQKIDDDGSYRIADTGGPSQTPHPEDWAYLNALRVELNNFAYIPVGPFRGAEAGRSTFGKMADGEYLLTKQEQAIMSYRAAEALDRLGGYLTEGTGAGLWLPVSKSSIPNSDATRNASRSLNIELRQALAFWAGVPRMFGDYVPDHRLVDYEAKSRNTLARLYRDEDSVGGSSARDGGIQLNHLRFLTERATANPRVPAVEDAYPSTPAQRPRPSVPQNALGEPIISNPKAISAAIESHLSNNPEQRQRFNKLVADYGIPGNERGSRLLNALRVQENKAGIDPQWTKTSIAKLFGNLTDNKPRDVHGAFVAGRSIRPAATSQTPSAPTKPPVTRTNGASALKADFNNAYAEVVPKDRKVISEARNNFFERFDAGGGFDPARAGDSAAYQSALVSAAKVRFPDAPTSADGSPRLSREEVRALLVDLTDNASNGPVSRAFSGAYAAATGRAPVARAAPRVEPQPVVTPTLAVSTPSVTTPNTPVAKTNPAVTPISATQRVAPQNGAPPAALTPQASAARTPNQLFADIKPDLNLFPTTKSLFGEAGNVGAFGRPAIDISNSPALGDMSDGGIFRDSVLGTGYGIVKWSSDAITGVGDALKMSALGYASLTNEAQKVITGHDWPGADVINAENQKISERFFQGGGNFINKAEKAAQNPWAYFVTKPLEEASAKVAQGKSAEVSADIASGTLDVASFVADVADFRGLLKAGKGRPGGFGAVLGAELRNADNFSLTTAGGFGLEPARAVSNNAPNARLPDATTPQTRAQPTNPSAAQNVGSSDIGRAREPFPTPDSGVPGLKNAGRNDVGVNGSANPYNTGGNGARQNGVLEINTAPKSTDGDGGRPLPSNKPLTLDEAANASRVDRDVLEYEFIPDARPDLQGNPEAAAKAMRSQLDAANNALDNDNIGLRIQRAYQASGGDGREKSLRDVLLKAGAERLAANGVNQADLAQKLPPWILEGDRGQLNLFRPDPTPTTAFKLNPNETAITMFRGEGGRNPNGNITNRAARPDSLQVGQFDATNPAHVEALNKFRLGNLKGGDLGAIDGTSWTRDRDVAIDFALRNGADAGKDYGWVYRGSVQEGLPVEGKSIGAPEAETIVPSNGANITQAELVTRNQTESQLTPSQASELRQLAVTSDDSASFGSRTLSVEPGQSVLFKKADPTATGLPSRATGTSASGAPSVGASNLDALGSNPWDDVSLDATSADDALSSARLGGRNDAPSAQQKLLAPGATPKLLAPADPLKIVPGNYKGSSRVASPTATASVREASTTPDINNVPDNYRAGGKRINSTDVPGVDEAGNLSTPQDTAGKVAAPQAAKDKTKKVPFIDLVPVAAQATAVAYSAGIGLYPNFQKPIVSSPLNELNSYLANTSEYLSKNVNVLPNGVAAPNTVQHRPHLDLANGDVTLGAPPVLYNSLMAEAKAKGYKNANQSSFFIAPDGALTVAAVDSGGAPRTLKLVLPASDRPLSERFGVEVKNTLNPDLAFVSGTSTKQGQFGELSITAKIGAPGTPTATIGVGFNANATNAKRTEINWLHIPSADANLLQAHTKNENFRFVASQMGTFSERPGQVLATDPTAIQPRAVAGFVIENFDREKASDWMFAPGKLPKGSAQIGAGVEVAGVTGLRLDDPLTGYTGRFNVGTQYFGGVGMYKPTTQGRGPAIDIDPKLNFVTAGFQYPPDDFKVAGPLAEFVGIPIPTNGAPMFTTAPPPKPLQNVPEVPPKPRAQSDGGDLIASSAWSSEGVPDNPFVDLRADGRFTPVSFKTTEQTPPKAFVDPLSDGVSDVEPGLLPNIAGPQRIATALDTTSNRASESADGLDIPDLSQPVNAPVGLRVAELEADAKRIQKTGGRLKAAGGLLAGVDNNIAKAASGVLTDVGDVLESGRLTNREKGDGATKIADAVLGGFGAAAGGSTGAGISALGDAVGNFGDRNVNDSNADGAVGLAADLANAANIAFAQGKDPALGAITTLGSGVANTMVLRTQAAAKDQEALTETDPAKKEALGNEAASLRQQAGDSQTTAIAESLGTLVGRDTLAGKILINADNVINAIGNASTNNTPGDLWAAAPGAVLQAAGAVANNPGLTLAGQGAQQISTAMQLGTQASQAIDPKIVSQLRGQQSGATISGAGQIIQGVGIATGDKTIATIGAAGDIAGKVVSLDSNGINGDAAEFGVKAGLQLLGTTVGGTAGKAITTAGSLYQGAASIAKGGFNNIANGAGSLISAVTSFLPAPIAKAGSIIGTALTAFSNPVSAVPALLMEVIPGAKDLPAKLFGTYKGKMGDNAQAFNIENARIRRDNDDDFFVDELQADGTYKNVQRFDHKGYFNKASEASQVNVADFDGDGKLDFSFKDNQYLNRAGADGAVRFVNGAEEAYAKAQTEMKTKMEAAPLVGGLYAVAGDNDGTPTWSFVDKDGFTVKGPGAITYEDQRAQGWVGVDQGGGNVVRVATADINYGTRGSKTIKINTPAIEANVSPATVAATASVTPATTVTAPAAASAQQKQWVSDIYYQELGRGVDPEAAVNWENAFASGATNIEAMRAALRASPEGANYANTQATLAYREVLGREPDAGGLTNNAALLRSGGQTVEQMRAALANSAEGQARVAAQANAVAQANAAAQTNAVAQTDTAAQANAPVQATVVAAPAVLATVTPAAVVEAQAPEVVAEPEAAVQPQATVTAPATVEAPTYFDVPLPPQAAVTAPATIEAQTSFDVPALAPPLQAPPLTAAQVASAYRELLNRDPDEGGLANNVALINSGAQTIEQVRANLAGSNEAKVNRAYQDFFGRGADPEGLQYWWNLMQSGQLNETQLRDSFAQIASQQKAA